MALTENGIGVADGVRGVTVQHLPASGDSPGGERIDGFCPRNSSRPDLYPHAPQQRGISGPGAGRLDEVTATPAPEPPPAIQALPPKAFPLAPLALAVQP